MLSSCSSICISCDMLQGHTTEHMSMKSRHGWRSVFESQLYKEIGQRGFIFCFFRSNYSKIHVIWHFTIQNTLLIGIWTPGAGGSSDMATHHCVLLPPHHHPLLCGQLSPLPPSPTLHQSGNSRSLGNWHFQIPGTPNSSLMPDNRDFHVPSCLDHYHNCVS